ncbi:ASCH domain-containing protein [Cellulomonas sp. C5510]|uniref:ASCH domain-containing protein n=1 Tax=Cellulomonas sp. C5510 TaxID=2871170 RepID=UPI001C98394A|nr:ASCH domain-containing protein [Cellulomonas sp. C5510]QZN86555.1 ASCH domain-containing protein [Cellulomonas sp. C5510]
MGGTNERPAGDADVGAEILAFWEVARVRAGVVRLVSVTGPDIHGTLVPPTWSAGEDPAEADRFLARVLDGATTASTTALADLEGAGQPLPVRGDLAIVLDGAGHPGALIRTTEVRTARLDEAGADGVDVDGVGALAPDAPVVVERFELLYPRSSDR